MALHLDWDRDEGDEGDLQQRMHQTTGIGFGWAMESPGIALDRLGSFIFDHKFCKFKARRNASGQLLENVSLSLISWPCLYWRSQLWLQPSDRERERSTYRCLISNIDKQTGSPVAVQSRPSSAVRHRVSLKFPASQHPNIPASQRPSWTLFYFFFNCCTASAGRMVGPLFAGQNVWQMPMPTITRAAISHGCNCDLNSLRCPAACPIVIIIVIIIYFQRRWRWRCALAGFPVQKHLSSGPKTSSSGSQLTLYHLRWLAGDPDTSENKIPIQIAPSINPVLPRSPPGHPLTNPPLEKSGLAWPEPELEVRNQMHVSNGPAADAASASWEIKL